VQVGVLEHAGGCVPDVQVGVLEACRWVCWRHAGWCTGGVQVGLLEACRWMCWTHAGGYAGDKKLTL